MRGSVRAALSIRCRPRPGGLLLECAPHAALRGRLLTYRPLDARGVALALLCSFFWGANPVAIKVGLVDAAPLWLASLRFVIGGITVLAWATWTGRLRGFRVEPAEWRPLAVLGLLLTTQIGIMNVGTDLTSAGHVAIILNSYAVHTVVLSHFLVPGDRLTPRRLAGALVGYAGIVVLFARQASTPGASALGDALVLLSALLLAERTVYLARAVQSLDPVKLLLAQAVTGSVLFALVSAAVEGRPTRWTTALAASLLFQGAVVAGFNFIVNLWLLRRYRPSVLSTIFLSQPIFGLLAAAAVTGEPLTIELLAAGLAVALGVWLSRR